MEQPQHVSRAIVLDIVPTYGPVTREFAMAYFHWFFLTQPAPFPEQLIEGAPETFLRRFLSRAGITSEAFAEYLRASREPGTVHGWCEDYRAGMTIDEQHEAERGVIRFETTAPSFSLRGHPMQHLAPVSSTQRLESLDVLRGFALLGILAMNIRAMATPMSAYMYPYALFDYEGPSRLAYLFTTVVFDLKMMGLFSMLFGAGVLLYANKRTESGRSPRALWFRRMFVLLAIGVLHAYFIWAGDILVPYALCGILVLWWMRNRTARTLLIAAVGMLAIGAALAVVHWLAWGSMSEADRAAELELMMPTREQALDHVALMLGAYTRFVAASAPGTFMFETMFFLMFFLWRCGGMMLLGMSLYKSGFLDGRLRSSTYARVALIATPVGLALASFGALELERVAYTMPIRAAVDLWNYVGAVFASIGYAATLIWIVKRGLLAGLRRRLAAVGQMALSNYLFHSVTASVLFLGWGFGLAGRFDYAAQLLIVVAIWIVQLIVSPIWLQSFRFGPAEWLWRTLTYGRLQPMRQEAPTLAPLAS